MCIFLFSGRFRPTVRPVGLDPDRRWFLPSADVNRCWTRIILLWLGSLFLAAAPAGVRAAEVQAAGDPALQELTAQLGSADPAQRDAAAQRLAAMGESARDAVMQAMGSSDPEIRARASKLLLALPWSRPTDPPAVRKMLEGYGQRNIAARQAVVVRLGAVPEGVGLEPLLRILRLEPSAAVRWTAVTTLSNNRSSTIHRRLIQEPEDPHNAPLLVVKAWAVLPQDQSEGLRLFQAALAADLAEPSQDQGNLSQVLSFLEMRARRQKDFDELARLLRRQAARGTDDGKAIFRLFALHAEHGPLEGYAADREAFAERISVPLWRYVQATLLRRRGRPAVGQLLELSAIGDESQGVADHYATGEKLLDAGWDRLAARELALVIQLADQGELPYATNAHFQLALIDQRRDDDAAVAEHLRQGVALAGRMGAAVAVGDDDGGVLAADEASRNLWARIHFHEFLAAKKRGEPAEANRQLNKVLELKPSSMELVLELVPAVRQAGRVEEARDVFERAYAEAKKRLDARPEEPELMNNLAWLCARCDERLEEARALSERSVELAPENPAYLDTLAEIYFRLGHGPRAAELEQRALELQPGDEFMIMQLERFRNFPASSTQPAPMPPR